MADFYVGSQSAESEIAELQLQVVEQAQEIAKLKDDLAAAQNNYSADMAQARRDDFKNVLRVERLSDQSVAVAFTSCRAASEFEKRSGKGVDKVEG